MARGRTPSGRVYRSAFAPVHLRRVRPPLPLPSTGESGCHEPTGSVEPGNGRAGVDGGGRPLAFEITPGQRGDSPIATTLLGPLPPSSLCAADTAYDSDALRRFLIDRGTLPVIPNNPTRKNIQPFDPAAYKRRNVIERTFCRLKDWRRIATRYDKLAANFASACCLAAIIIWWI